MKILMFVNWKIQYCDSIPIDKQPPDYCVKDGDYWFYRYFEKKPEVDVVDIRSVPWIEDFEKNKLRFYVWQTLKKIPHLKDYDLIISHGMQSGVVLSLWRKIFKTRAKHIVFDIGSFNSAAETGSALKLMQSTSRSVDGFIYHTSSQMEYYQRFFPWIVPKCHFIKFGVDPEFFCPKNTKTQDDKKGYMICVGYSKRDWDTVVHAYIKLDGRMKLRLVGHIDDRYKNIKGIEQISVIPIKDLISQIEDAEFCILPLRSYNYSYGQMTLMQQMALSKCVIAARVPSLIDYIRDMDTAVGYDPGDSNDLAEKMLYLIEHKEVCMRIGCNARRYIEESNNEEIMAKEIEKVLKMQGPMINE